MNYQSSTARPEWRALGIIASLQVFALLTGTLVLRFMVSLYGYPKKMEGRYFFPSAIWVYHYGVWLLLVPVVWSALTSLAQHKLGQTWLTTSLLILGMAMVPLAAYLLLSIAFHPLPRWHG